MPSYHQLLEKLNETTTKQTCECTLKTVIQKYNKFNGYLPQNEQREFDYHPLSWQYAFVCYTLNLKLKDKSKQKNNKKNITTHNHLSL